MLDVHAVRCRYAKHCPYCCFYLPYMWLFLRGHNAYVATFCLRRLCSVLVGVLFLLFLFLLYRPILGVCVCYLWGGGHRGSTVRRSWCRDFHHRVLLPILLHPDIFAWFVVAGAGVELVTCVGTRWGVISFRAYAWVAAGSVVLWYGWKLTHRTRQGLEVSVSKTMMWCSSITWRYRAGVALGASLDICFLFANSGMVPGCPKSRNWGTLGAVLVHIVYGRALVAWCRMLLFLNASSLRASPQCVLRSPLWCSAALAEFIRGPLIFSALPFR